MLAEEWNNHGTRQKFRCLKMVSIVAPGYDVVNALQVYALSSIQ